MPRLARTVCARAPHHITQRGNRREEVFFADDDRHAYLGWLKQYAEKYEVLHLAHLSSVQQQEIIRDVPRLMLAFICPLAKTRVWAKN